MPMKLISKDQYRALYKESLFILKKICHHKKKHNQQDLEDIAHLCVELYAMKITKNMFYNLEMAAQEALTSYKNARNLKQDRHHQDTFQVNFFSQYEAQRDLDIIYIRAEKKLSFLEKYLFCKLLNDLTFEQIALEMRLKSADLQQIQESLMGKLYHAATSSTKSKKPDRNDFIGKLRSWPDRFN